MAKTGSSYELIGPFRVDAGFPRVEPLAEASVQTYLQGAPVLNSAGYLTEYTAGGGTLHGFAADAGQNGASAGAKTGRYYRAGGNVRFVGTLNATLTQAMIGSVATLIKASSSWYLETATSVSSDAECVILGPVLPFAVGDTDPLVEFAVLESKIGDL